MIKQTAKTKSAKTTSVDRRKYMDRGTFAELRRALEDALDYERGTRRDLVVTHIQNPLKARLAKRR
jgi:hypothetical protein